MLRAGEPALTLRLLAGEVPRADEGVPARPALLARRALYLAIFICSVCRICRTRVWYKGAERWQRTGGA